MNWFQGYFIPAFFTIVFHLTVMLVAGWGWDANSDSSFKRPTPRHINAKLVKIEASDKKSKAKKAKKVQKAKKVPKVKKKDDAKKKALALKRKKEAQRKKQEAENKRKAAAVKAEEKHKAEEKRREEEELRRKEELEEQQRIEAEQQLALALEEEEEFVAAESDEELVSSFALVIRKTIERNWSRPPSARTGMRASLVIHLIPTGQVVSVVIVKSSGNDAFDRSVENAVNKSERFPELKDVPSRVFEKYFRRLKLEFKPEGLRL